ncbi:DUF3857 domain-containing protein [Flavobacterium sp.]|uniref:DUF3857 domain-containing protein n=1 Tax=Flavobacterium sp. TaxID=239 RepID=UPI0039E21525
MKLSAKLLLASGLIVVSKVSAQQTLADYKKLYPDYNELVLHDLQQYDFSIQDKKLRVVQDNHYESMILSDMGIQNDQETFTYSELIKLNNYDAYSVLNTNGREKKIKVTQTNENPYRDNSIFHNEVKERQLIFPNLEAGAKKVYDYQVEFVDPYLLHKYIFYKGLPVRNATLEIKTDKNIEIGYKIFNDPENSIAFSKTEKKGKYIYSWTLKDAKPQRFEAESPGILYQLPHINVYIKNYKIDDQNITVLDGVDQLYNYYRGFVKNLNKTENAELKALSIELTKNQPDELSKVKSIFYWVKDNIKYIAFENGYEGFIPREASVVYERKYGDCKDMGSIISAMAHYAGIKNVAISWIGTRDIPYSYGELPTPAVDNHMIAVYKAGEKYYFLDATDKYTRFGLPTGFIQGKQAMVYGDEKFTIVDVPLTSAEDNMAFDQADVKIEGDKLIGTGKLTLEGYNRSDILSAMGDITGKARQDFMKELLLKGNNKFKLVSYSEENAADRDLPYIINSKFEIDNYLVRVDQDIYVGLCMDKRFEMLQLEDDRQWKFDLHFMAKSASAYALEIPAGYKVKYVPEPFKIDNELFYVDAKYTTKGNKIKVDILLHSKKIMLDKSDFKLWNETIRKMKNYFSESLILSQN